MSSGAAQTANDNETASLLKHILAELRQQNSGKDTLWNADDIANYMRLTKGTVQSRVITNQSFPLAIKIPSSESGGGRRWLAAEVKEWVKRYKVKQ